MSASRSRRVLRVLIPAGAIAVLAVPFTLAAARQAGEPSALEVPRSVRNDHEVLHSGLVEATKASGKVGAAAQALADIIEPHWLREEQMAMPVLGLLAPLAAGTRIADADRKAAVSMTESFRKEMPSMLGEHKRNREAIAALRAAAQAASNSKVQLLADALTQHAMAEEDVMYPSALVVGDLLRARPAGR